MINKKIICLNERLNGIFFNVGYCNYIMLTSILLFILCISVFGGMHFVNADNLKNYEKSFMTVEIEAGDTLTSIAEEYAISEAEYSDYIEEVQCINNLKNDEIHTGCFLLVPVYECIEE